TKIFIDKFIEDNKDIAMKTHHITIPANFPKDKFGMEQNIFKFFQQNKVIITDELVGKKYFYEDSLNNFSWKILPDTITINSYLCQKATSYFRGRDYIAWFSEKIPIQNGPIKFGGLPGLIFEISDTKRKFVFTLLNIEKMLPNEIMEIKMSNATQISRKRIRELRKVLFEDPIGFMNAQGGQITINSSTSNLNKKYDPMELE
ncbi:MAG TPA: GLPGLI family protein, partial [Chitinophagaceae bacterium]|nr:GLPGLI family protein [Chitinophagaceae bacterium]